MAITRPTNSLEKTDRYTLKDNASTTKYNEENQNLLVEIALRVRDLADKKGVHFNEIAPVIGVSTGVLSKVINAKGFVEMSIMIRLAQYFNVSMDYILGISEVKELSNEQINKMLGLSDESIDTITMLKNKSKLNLIFDNDYININFLLDETQKFIDLTKQLNEFEKEHEDDDRLQYNNDYYKLYKEVQTASFNMSQEYIRLISNNIK